MVRIQGVLGMQRVVLSRGSRGMDSTDRNCWLIRVSLFIELGGAGDLGTMKRGAFSTFMISRPILHGSDWWKF